MQLRHRLSLMITAFVLFSPLLAVPRAHAVLALGLIDRKFPSGQYCPVETRNGNLVSFVAPENGTVRITFVAANEFPDFSGELVFDDPRIDNLLLMTLDQWNQNQNTCSSDCFAFNFTNGQPGTPAYPTDAASLAAIAYAELFATDPYAEPTTTWEGGTWVGGLTAPADDATATECGPGGPTTGGSLALGDVSAGDVSVSASVLVGGLTPGETYVVFCWFYLEVTNDDTPAQLQIQVDETSVVAAAERSFGALKASFR